MALGLKQLKKFVVAFNHDGCPKWLRFLPKSEIIRDSLPVKNGKSSTADYVLITVDSGDFGRLGPKFDGHQFASIWNIDHHASNTRFGDENFIDLKAGSTGQVVYDLLSTCRGFKLNRDIANAIFCTLSTDTGSFKYSNATSQVFALASRLVEAGAKPGELSENLYGTYPRSRLELMKQVLPSMRFDHDGKIAKLFVTLDDLKAASATKEDFDGFETLPRGVPGVKVVCLFKEKVPGEWAFSLRSRENVDVLKIASRFGGGGHKLAAGCTVRGTREEVEAQFERAITELGYV
jgi:bifunctional oligoribonuclease and PAP phosphatase NrnA